MIKFLEEKKYDYMMLIHRPQMNAIIHQTMSHPFIEEDNSELSFPANEQDHVDQFISSRRVSLSVNRDQEFMMAFAWTISHEKQTFENFQVFFMWISQRI